MLGKMIQRGAHHRRAHRRLAVPIAMLLAVVLFGTCAVKSASAFDFDDVALRAKTLAAKDYVKPASNLPKDLASLNGDQYEGIQFRAEKSPWAKPKLPFDIGFYHEGYLFDQQVKINEINGSAVKAMRFDPSDFNYGDNKLDVRQLRALGFAGFRLNYPINTARYKDEVVSFLGASYFRALGKDQQYGLSARGLAIDTGLNSGEEFPQFVEFWVEKPKATDKQLTVYALLNSRRVTGAYRFIVKPGVETVMDVKAQLYLRESVSKLGIAPLTSMFFFGENQRSQVEDYRPEVHDSDGLLVASKNGEWIWRPLVNPKRLLVTSYALNNPVGFGLMQRDRDFKDYQDLQAHYEDRPSVWVQPKGNWGAGRVELVQIPTPDETNDNIVAYWVPNVMPKVGQAMNVEYSLSWQKNAEPRPPLAWVTQTRRGNNNASNTTQRKVESSNVAITLMVDFDGPSLKKLPASVAPEAVVSVDDNGKLLSVNMVKNDAAGGWRMEVKVRRNEENKPVELRGFLRDHGTTLSETWSYILPPN
ncbi:glucan biosynthesis protein G [Glaciimonas soli]|uniref:Glucans biosynthesis protein G n=1 Tax=Glaciimonas soli TaxID=2590999 RepID=A0A843YRM3_9BURK|nr:glucans biosynthesis protein MdoG [Glaciimonas soli]